MSESAFTSAEQPEQGFSSRLNEECFCITLDNDALCTALREDTGDPAFCANLIKTHPHLISHAAVFVSGNGMEEMRQAVRAIEAVARLPDYRAAVLSWAPAIARRDYGPLGVFMGYDFHLTAEGPKLIEVNTNAGGAFVNALLARAQRACCIQVERALARPETADFDAAVVDMFRHEWMLQRGTQELRRIAIIDERPESQYLYPEFLLAQRVLMKHGIETVIADARELMYQDNVLRFEGRPIDLIYNRLVDFGLADPEHNALRTAYIDNNVVVTPNPHVHAIFADKRNMSLLSDHETLLSWGVSSDILAALAAVPRAVIVTADNAHQLWETRRKLFFKPAGGHGSKAVYRGSKLTKGVWAGIVRGCYVAQEFAAPSRRMIKIDGRPAARKVDVRLYVYGGRVLLSAARLYEGQTTNFRTEGGGFAPLFAVE